ncbi:coenzyme F390 synthetase [Candidatus Scalindua japonica]|uniref:Coenzyme F390 synthetase n=2 Tax=Candidatus Scalindua japonica TaxID=1284222 RepID=A0A286U2E7_9BACT|nr:coenzyme F390 synthetase [Candidatus Scalindua japonica]
MPAYAKLLNDKGINQKDINTIDDFQEKVPFFTKKDFFVDTPMEELCVDKNIQSLKLAVTSSGFSGVFSLGMSTEQDQNQSIFAVDTLLEYLINISEKKTFLINCVPMGVKIPTSLPIAEVSVRSDMALALINKFTPYFEQILIIGDPHFLKKIIEDGLEQGLDWKNLSVNFITGEDWFSENFRLYLADLLEIDFNRSDSGFFGANFGIAELDLSLFHESIYTIRLRQELQKNTRLREKIFGKNTKIIPLIFQYYPHKVFLETTQENELLFSMLNPDILMPLIRYNSQDQGAIRSYEEVKKILTEENCQHLIPDLKLPLVSVTGRSGRSLTVHGKTVTPEEIKEGLYSDYEVAFLTTGYFKLSQMADNEGKIEIQLKKGVMKTAELKTRFTKALLKHVDADIEIHFYDYQDFPYGMDLDYERKFKCI